MNIILVLRFLQKISRGLICFFEGLLFRELLEKYTPHKKTLSIFLCAGYLVLFVYIFITNKAFVSTNLIYTLCSTVYPCVIILFKAPVLERICSNGIFWSISGISYYTYLLHESVIKTVKNIYALKGLSYKTERAMLVMLVISLLVGIVANGVENRVRSKQKK